MIFHHGDKVFVNGMEITPFDDPWTYHVKSRSQPGHHVVDLLENKKLGHCTCMGFAKKFAEYRILDGTVKDKRRYRCAHIKACLEYLDESVLNACERTKKIREARPAEF